MDTVLFFILIYLLSNLSPTCLYIYLELYYSFSWWYSSPPPSPNHPSPSSQPMHILFLPLLPPSPPNPLSTPSQLCLAQAMVRRSSRSRGDSPKHIAENGKISDGSFYKSLYSHYFGNFRVEMLGFYYFSVSLFSLVGRNEFEEFILSGFNQYERAAPNAVKRIWSLLLKSLT